MTTANRPTAPASSYPETTTVDGRVRARGRSNEAERWQGRTVDERTWHRWRVMRTRTRTLTTTTMGATNRLARVKVSAAPRVVCERARTQLRGEAAGLERWAQQGAVTASRRSSVDGDGTTKSIGKAEPGSNDGGSSHPYTRAERRGRVMSRVNHGCARVESAARCVTKDVGNYASSLASDWHARATAGAATRRM